MSLKLASVEKIYEDNENLKKEDANKIFEWLETQPHLPEMTELQILLFLTSCSSNLDMTRTTIENYFTVRTEHAKFFDCVSEEVIRRTLAVSPTFILPKKTPEGYIICMIKFLDTNPKNYNHAENFNVLTMLTMLYLHQHGPANGLLTLVDCKGICFSHLFRLNYSVLKHSTFFYQHAVPLQLRGTHFINSIPVINRAASMIRPFLKSEVYEMYKFHDDHFETVFEYIPKELLPEDYGGDLPSAEALNDASLRNILDNVEFFRWHDTQKILKK